MHGSYSIAQPEGPLESVSAAARTTADAAVALPPDGATHTFEYACEGVDVEVRIDSTNVRVRMLSVPVVNAETLVNKC